MSRYSAVALALLLAGSSFSAGVQQKKAPPREPDLLYDELAARSFPADKSLASLANPWGERLGVLDPLPADFAHRLLTAAQVYADQKVRFDGYVGSDDDGRHYAAAVDGIDAAYIGDEKSKTYRLVRNSVPDDLKERVWICQDYALHAVSLAGFPLRDAMIADFQSAPNVYLANGYFPGNKPTDSWYFRRILNVRRYCMRRQFYYEDRITVEQYRDPAFTPGEPFRPGDLLFMGHYFDEKGMSPWIAQHSGIVATVNERGLPVKIYNMRVSQKMLDTYDGLINQTREIGGEKKFFKRFSDRYSIVGHARLVNGFRPGRDPGGWIATEPEEMIATIRITNKDFER